LVDFALLAADGLMVALETKYVILEAFPQANGLVWKKTKPNTTKTRIRQSKETYCMTQNKHKKKLKPGLVAFYDIRPGHGAGLFSEEKTSNGGHK